MVKAEDAYERVRQYGSLTQLARAREIEEARMKRQLNRIRAARKRADKIWLREINRPALDLWRKQYKRTPFSDYAPEWEAFRQLEAEIEASKPHLWPQFLAEYRESLGLPPVRSNPLESITRTSMGEPWSPVPPIYRPLLSLRTQEKFIRAFASWGIPVGITVVTADNTKDRAYKKVEAAVRDHAARGRGLRVFVWAQPAPDMEGRPRFDPGRATLFTPFTLMHRVGDELNIGGYPAPYSASKFFRDNEYVRAFRAASEDFRDYFEMSSRAVPAEIREALEDDPAEGWGSLNGVKQLGVDTAAGRQMFFEDGPSDVFAKLILYRKWAYPDALDLRRVTPVQMEQWAQALRESYGVRDPTINLVAVLGQYLRSGAYADLRMYYTELLQRQIEAAIRMLEVSNGAIIV